MTEPELSQNSEVKPNPLHSYIRQECVYIKLPSCGYYNSPGDITFTANGEVGVKPLSASDEITLNTPDSLLNNDAVSKVISSCVPAVKDPHLLVAPDIDALLAAIRLATYGEFMDVSVTCPECDHEQEFQAPIQYCIDTMKFLDSEYNVKLSEKCGNLTVSVRPFTFIENTKEALQRYNEVKAMRLIAEKDLEDEENQKEYKEHVYKIADYNIEMVANCILNIYDSDGNEIDVTYDQIVEWIKNIPSQDAQAIIGKVSEINKTGINTTATAICENCEHQWETELSFDPSYFFDFGSST